MPTVTLATHCHSRDLPRLHAPGVLEELISCHAYLFDEILVAHQRTGNLSYALPDDKRIKILNIREEDYESILGGFAIPHKEPRYSEITHGWTGPHYYEHHCVNHLKEILSSTCDYILFTDADCRIVNQPEGQSWVSKAIEILENHLEVLIVAPSDGGHEFDRKLEDGTRLTLTVSQQIFIGKRKQLLMMDFTNLQWDGKFDAPYGPFPEFYVLFEGWLWRWMRAHGMYRAVLPESFRYNHEMWH